MVFAQLVPVGGTVDPLSNNPGLKSIAGIVGFVSNMAMGVAIVFSVIYIILAGIRFMMSEGDPKGIKEARDRLTYAVIGLIVALVAYTIRRIVLNALGGTTPVVNTVL